MVRSLRSGRVLVVAAVLLAAVTACGAPAPSPSDDSPSVAPTPSPVALYTLEASEHRNPIPIV